MHFNVHSTTIYKSQDRKANKMSDDRWIKKMWYMYTMGYYSAIKRNAFDSVLTRWMNLEPVIQSEVRKTNIIY